MQFDKEKLRDIYESNTNATAAEIVGVSVPTLLKMIDKAGIERKGSGRPYQKQKQDGEKIDIAVSTELSTYFEGYNGVLLLFIYLLSDKQLAENNWSGKSGVYIENKFFKMSKKENIKSLNYMKNQGIISSYSIDQNGLISVGIIDRERFVHTFEEYCRMLEEEN